MPDAGVEEVQELLRAGRAARPAPLSERERRVQAGVGTGLLLAAIALAVAAPSPVAFHPVQAAALVVLYAAASRIRFEVAFVQTDPALLVLVPMLFALPAHDVPLLVVLAFVLGRIPDYVRGTVHPDRLLSALGDGWHAFGPALVLAVATDGGPHSGDWPWFALALAAMLLLDALAGIGRGWLSLGVRPEVTARMMGGVYVADVLLAPVGLLVAYATEQASYAFLLSAPLAVVLVAYAREREGRISSSLELAEERARALEAELEGVRAREAVLVAVSQGMQAPLAGVVAAATTLDTRDESLALERRGLLRRELVGHASALRHLVRQTLDFQRLQSGQALETHPVALELEALVTDAAERTAAGRRPVMVRAREDLPLAWADPERVRQVVTSLVDNACRAAPPGGSVEVHVQATADALAVTVVDRGRGLQVSAGDALFAAPLRARGTGAGAPAGIGLHVGRAVARAMGGDLTADPTALRGARLVLTLPRASEG